MKSQGLHKAFISGSTSTYHTHVKLYHFEIYQEWCKEKKIEMHWHAIPEGENKGDKMQGTLTRVFKKIEEKVPQEFTKKELLDANARFIVTDDQVRTFFFLSNIPIYLQLAGPGTNQEGSVL